MYRWNFKGNNFGMFSTANYELTLTGTWSVVYFFHLNLARSTAWVLLYCGAARERCAES